jgi:hypothetical protein
VKRGLVQHHLVNLSQVSFFSNREVESYLARLFAYTALLVLGAVTPAWWGFFGVANLACDLGERRVRSCFGIAIADTKIREHETDGLTMDADTGSISFGQGLAFFG